MSEIRVDKIEPNTLGGDIVISGITTFSSGFYIPGGNVSQRPADALAGQIRYVEGEVTYMVEYYNGTNWVQI